ncbi:MAG: dTDP-4-dehydrorhamnose 3,5-epimerase [Gemmobacter sp.]
MIEATAIPDVRIVTPRRFGDDRGWFSETWSRRALAAQGIDVAFVQDNQSFSRPVHTLRGLHMQRPPHAQAKLVRVLRGRILDVAVDIRRASPTYGRWVAVELSAADGRQLFIPEGFLHGFVTREPETEVAYKCNAYYAPDCEGAVRWDDPDLAIDWGIAPGDAVLSAKDAAAPAFRDLDTPF